MPSTNFVGVDPGRTGALALITNRKSVKVWDMPPHRQGERGIDLYALSTILVQIGVEGTEVALEWNGGRAHDTPDRAFVFGLQTGQLDAALFARGYNVTHLASNKWTGRFGLPGKTHAGAVEQRAALWDRMYPPYANLIRGSRGGLLDGRIDALLIAEYLRQANMNPTGHKGGRKPPTYRGVPDGELQDFWNNLTVEH